MRTGILVSMVASIACSVLPALSAESGKLVVDVSGLKNDKGVVRVAVFNSGDAYKADKDNDGSGSVNKTTAPIKDGKASCSFADLPYGTYGVKFFHDEDNSGKFITGMFGLPKVEYGFSNNVKGAFGPPSFEKIKFSLSKPEVDLALHP